MIRSLCRVPKQILRLQHPHRGGPSILLNTSLTMKRMFSVDQSNKVIDSVADKKLAGIKSKKAELAERMENIDALSTFNNNPYYYGFYKSMESNYEKNGWMNALETEVRNVTRMQDAGVLTREDTFNAVNQYVLLQNPLLKKYKFEPKEFIIGAQTALVEVRRALCSKALYNFANNMLNEDKSATVSSVVGVAGEHEDSKKNKNTNNDSDDAAMEAAEDAIVVAAAGSPISPNSEDEKESTTATAAATTAATDTYAHNIDYKDADFLKEVLYPALYSKCVDALREMQSNGFGFTDIPADIDIQKANIVDIDVRIVTKEEEEAIAEDNMMISKLSVEEDVLLEQRSNLLEQRNNLEQEINLLKEPILTATASANAAKDHVDDHLHTEIMKRANMQVNDGKDEDPVMSPIRNSHFKTSAGDVIQIPTYPEGSVIVDVKVRFLFNNRVQSTEKFDKRMPSSAEWVFTGCISDHVPLEYKVTSFGY